MFNLAFLIVGFWVTQSAWATPQTVPYVDIHRYMGTWYEIATIEQRFERGCRCTQAEYSLNPKGYVNVLNSCIRNEKVKPARGRGYIADTQSNAKLKVGFFLPSLPFFRGDYWIIGLDIDYRYAVISNSDSSSFWILARERTLNSTLLNEALKIAENAGIDLSKSKLANQQNCELLDEHR